MDKVKKKKKNKSAKNRVIAGGAAALASAGVVLAGLFGSPEELTALPTDFNAPIVCAVSSDDAADPEESDAVVPEEKRKSILARLKMKILSLPAVVRAVVGVPLWCVGWVLLFLFSQLWGHVLSPVLGWLLAALLLLAVLVGCVKAAFPDMPLKKILNKRTVWIVVMGMLATGAAGLICSAAAPEKELMQHLVKFGVSTVVLLLAAVPILFPGNPETAEVSDPEIRRLEEQLFPPEQ